MKGAANGASELLWGRETGQPRVERGRDPSHFISAGEYMDRRETTIPSQRHASGNWDVAHPPVPSNHSPQFTLFTFHGFSTISVYLLSSESTLEPFLEDADRVPEAIGATRRSGAISDTGRRCTGAAPSTGRRRGRGRGS